MKTTSARFSAVAVISFVVVQPPAGAAAAQDSNAIRPFTVPTVPKSALEDLRRRVGVSRWEKAL